MNDFITSLLNLKGSQGLNSEILSSNDSQLCVQLEHPPEARFCPHCNYRMHSKGNASGNVKTLSTGHLNQTHFLLSKLDAGLQILLIF